MTILSLSTLTPEVFESVCVHLLKNEISPNVRQTTLFGVDGGRDLFLEGPCTTGRYPWSGSWVFQCKHTVRGQRQEAARLFKIFERDFTECIERYPRTQNYLLLFSSFQSGHTKVGLVDRLHGLVHAAAKRRVRFDFWDGLEIIHLLVKYQSVSDRFFPARSSLSVPKAFSEAELPLFDVRPTKTEDEAGRLLRSLVNTEFPLFTPSNRCVLSSLSFRLGPLKLLNVTRRYFAAIKRFIPGLLVRTDTRYFMAAFLLFHAAALVRMNYRVPEAERLLRRLLRTLGSDFVELRAFAMNLQSIIYGKTEKRFEYERTTLNCITIATENSLHWLSTSVALRHLHKTNWLANEQGGGPDHALFEDQARVSVAKARSLTYEEVKHTEGQMNSVLALHYRWHADSLDKAAQTLGAAKQAFVFAPDRSEMARLSVEEALLEQTAYGRSEYSLQKLKTAAAERAEVGDYARLRYDLYWLSERYERQGLLPHALYCLIAAERLHSKLYAGANVDRNFVTKLLWKQEQLAAVLGSRIKSFDDSMLSSLEGATGVSGLIWREVL